MTRKIAIALVLFQLTGCAKQPTIVPKNPKTLQHTLTTMKPPTTIVPKNPKTLQPKGKITAGQKQDGASSKSCNPAILLCIGIEAILLVICCMCNWNKPKASSISPSSISSKVMEFLEGIKNEVEVINEELEEKDKINRTNIERDVEEKMEDSKKELSEGNVEITIEDLKNFTIKNYIKLLKQDHDSLIEHRRKGEDIDNTLRAVRSHYLILIKKITQLAILEYRLKT